MTSVGPAAGLLAGRKVTSYCACAAERRLAGANWQTDQVVVDGSLVTAQAWPDNPGLLRAFIDLLGAKIAICWTGSLQARLAKRILQGFQPYRMRFLW